MKNKKKMLVLVLLLFVAVGFAGYGVYSYYYTQGSFNTESAGGSEDADNVVRITGSFKPSTNGAGGSGMENAEGFFKNGGQVYLTCPEDVSFGTTTCTGEITVSNEGSTEIYVDYYDTTSSAESSDFYVTADSPSFYWENGDYDSTVYISAGSSKTLHFNVDVNISSSADPSEEAQLVTDPVSSSSNVTAYVRFKLSATQSH